MYQHRSESVFFLPKCEGQNSIRCPSLHDFLKTYPHTLRPDSNVLEGDRHIVTSILRNSERSKHPSTLSHSRKAYTLLLNRIPSTL